MQVLNTEVGAHVYSMHAILIFPIFHLELYVFFLILLSLPATSHDRFKVSTAIVFVE